MNRWLARWLAPVCACAALLAASSSAIGGVRKVIILEHFGDCC